MIGSHIGWQIAISKVCIMYCSNTATFIHKRWIKRAKRTFHNIIISPFSEAARCAIMEKRDKIDLHCRDTVEMYTTIIGGFDVCIVCITTKLSWLLLVTRQTNATKL